MVAFGDCLAQSKIKNSEVFYVKYDGLKPILNDVKRQKVDSNVTSYRNLAISACQRELDNQNGEAVETILL